MQQAALGFRVHSGWTALVAVTLEKKSPLVLIRRKLQLVKIFSYTFRQPYHTAEKMPIPEAAEFVRGVESESRELARNGIREVQEELAGLEYKLSGFSLLLASGRELPEFEKILASHALIHTADGELFRDSLRRAAARCKLPVTAVKERDLLAVASKSLRLKPEVLTCRITDLGKSLGAPWTQDEKLSALAAWLTLVQ
jgi:hypothetical protein